MTIRRDSFRKLLLGLALALTATLAQAYPDRPITMLIGFAPGGGADIIGRIIAQKMSDILRQPVIVENKPGANSMIGAHALVRAKPDGYTIMLNAASLSIAAATYKKLSFNPIKDLQPISLLATYPYLVTVPSSLPVKNLKDFVAYAKACQGKLNYGSSGTGSAPQMGMELLNSVTGIRTNHIPYKGSGPAIIDLVAGRISVMLTEYLGAGAMIRSHSLRVLAVTSAKRSENLPDVPTAAELGYSNYDVVGWYGLDAPVGTPALVIDALYKAAAKAVLSPAVVKHLKDEGAIPMGSTPAHYRAFFMKDLERWQAVAKKSHISLD
ncbi:Bug family tripartite tricarboxylate transporter substrate binding protein [Paralcaligenes ureilyticus]|uniref:Tripartite-type tricarboxylate transporter receptor subunit TctC n=1 Tax=Paralcaligenes ureilyticus TaxID=627131 RepID=A0A4R3M825_9BURK|nr:tripartite tricarboxylate transporter substrate binding protein [Paralcaligenes ureilyticus]TCT09644.1 tripartite-type tricarboxylate transporter receptor subunit TctC [Paralcaligenes ureilyticus]